jgi:hypothetical protein
METIVEDLARFLNTTHGSSTHRTAEWAVELDTAPATCARSEACVCCGHQAIQVRVSLRIGPPFSNGFAPPAGATGAAGVKENSGATAPSLYSRNPYGADPGTFPPPISGGKGEHAL